MDREGSGVLGLPGKGELGSERDGCSQTPGEGGGEGELGKGEGSGRGVLGLPR